MLLTDGSVLVQAAPEPADGVSAADFYILTPDANGDYAKGTWRKIASPPAGYAPYATNEAVLADGRVLFVGGEYNQDQYQICRSSPSALTNMSAIYDPATDSWTMIPAPGGPRLYRRRRRHGAARWPASSSATNWSSGCGRSIRRPTWSAVAFTGYPANDFAEMGFTLLPSGVGAHRRRHEQPATAITSFPSTGTWIADGPTPATPRRADRYAD